MAAKERLEARKKEEAAARERDRDEDDPPKRGRKRYKQRKHIAEPPFGWMKRVLGFRQFSLRGRRKVAGEFDLICVALNLRRMGTMICWT